MLCSTSRSRRAELRELSMSTTANVVSPISDDTTSIVRMNLRRRVVRWRGTVADGGCVDLSAGRRDTLGVAA